MLKCCRLIVLICVSVVLPFHKCLRLLRLDFYTVSTPRVDSDAPIVAHSCYINLLRCNYYDQCLACEQEDFCERYIKFKGSWELLSGERLAITYWRLGRQKVLRWRRLQDVLKTSWKTRNVCWAIIILDSLLGQNFSKRKWGIVYKKTDKWYNEWQRLTASGNEWQLVIQRVTTSDNKWQWVIASDSSGTTNENEICSLFILCLKLLFRITISLKLAH